MAENSAVVRKETSDVGSPESTRGGLHYTPRVDIYETEDELVVLCDMPGVKPDEVDLRFENGELALHGKVQPRQANVAYLLNEYGVGDFYRSFSVSEQIQPDKISAEYRHGVLTIHLPKKEAAKPKRIAIRAE
jgi:HSP20 family protein